MEEGRGGNATAALSLVLGLIVLAATLFFSLLSFPGFFRMILCVIAAVVTVVLGFVAARRAANRKAALTAIVLGFASVFLAFTTFVFAFSKGYYTSYSIETDNRIISKKFNTPSPEITKKHPKHRKQTHAKPTHVGGLFSMFGPRKSESSGKFMSPGKFIRGAGFHELDGKFVRGVDVTRGDNGESRLTFVQRRGNVANSPPRPLDTGWFVYAGPDDRFWVYYGGDGDVRHDIEGWTFSERMHTMSDLSHADKLSEFPEAALKELPEVQRKKLIKIMNEE